jgi:hypothetical protein
MLGAMEGFALSERWNGWEDLGVMLSAARAAVAEGPLEPLLCEIEVEWDDDVTTLASLDALEAIIVSGEEPLGIEIWLAHEVREEAYLTLCYNGRWLQLNGYGSDWVRARQAYYAAQVELAASYGITTFVLPKLPKDTVQEVRRQLESQD